MLIITEGIKLKLKYKHFIHQPEKLVRKAFKAFNGLLLVDTREQHIVRGIPTEWFIAKVGGAFYKVIFLRIGDKIVLKSAYKIRANNPFNRIYQNAMADCSSAKRRRTRRIIQSLL